MIKKEDKTSSFYYQDDEKAKIDFRSIDSTSVDTLSLIEDQGNTNIIHAILISSFIFSLSLILSLLLCFVHYNQVFSFVFDEDYHNTKGFQTSNFSIYLIILYLISSNLYFCYNYLLKPKDRFFQDIYKGYNKRYIFSLMIYSFALFATTMIQHRIVNLIIFTSVNALLSVTIYSNYRNIKSKFNYNNISYFTIYCYISLLYSCVIYFFIYGFTNILSINNIIYNEYQTLVTMIANSVYCLITIVFVSHFKDVYFLIVYLVIEIGYYSQTGLSQNESNLTLFLISFSFISLFFTVYKYRLEAIGYVKNDDTDRVLTSHRNEFKFSMEGN